MSLSVKELQTAYDHLDWLKGYIDVGSELSEVGYGLGSRELGEKADSIAQDVDLVIDQIKELMNDIDEKIDGLTTENEPSGFEQMVTQAAIPPFTGQR